MQLIVTVTCLMRVNLLVESSSEVAATFELRSLSKCDDCQKQNVVYFLAESDGYLHLEVIKDFLSYDSIN